MFCFTRPRAATAGKDSFKESHEKEEVIVNDDMPLLLRGQGARRLPCLHEQTSGTQGDSERSELAEPGNRVGESFLYSIFANDREISPQSRKRVLKFLNQ